MKANYTNNGVDIRLEVTKYQKGEVPGAVDSVDFLVYIEKSNGEEYSLYLLTELDGENHVCALSGEDGQYDGQDDYGLLPKFIDEEELINDMNTELEAYKKR